MNHKIKKTMAIFTIIIFINGIVGCTTVRERGDVLRTETRVKKDEVVYKTSLNTKISELGKLEISLTKKLVHCPAEEKLIYEEKIYKKINQPFKTIVTILNFPLSIVDFIVLAHVNCITFGKKREELLAYVGEVFTIPKETDSRATGKEIEGEWKTMDEKVLCLNNEPIKNTEVIVKLLNGQEETLTTDNDGRASLDIFSYTHLLKENEKLAIEVSAKVDGKTLIQKLNPSLNELVDWSIRQPKLPPYLVTQLSLDKDSNQILSGDKLQLSLKVENKGKGAAYRLLGKIESTSELLNGYRFYFGKLEAGQNLTRKLTVNIPKPHPTKNIPIKITWQEANDYIPDPIEMTMHIQALPRPEFAYNYQIVDDMSGNSVGNGDGRIQKGEAVDLLLGIKNVGQGVADDIQIKISPVISKKVFISYSRLHELSNTEGEVRLQEPQAGISHLAPGESKSIRLTATVLKKSQLNKLTLALSISESTFGVKLEDRLELALDTRIAPQITPLKQVMVAKSKRLDIYGGAGEDTKVIAYIEQGNQVQVTGQLGEWYRIDLEEQSGWVKAKQLVKISKATPASTVQTQASLKPTVIKVYNKMPPVIVIASPKDNFTTFKSEVDLRGIVEDDNEIARVLIEVNGQRLTTLGQRGISINQKLGHLKSIDISETIPLKMGQNTISITAYDNDNLPRTKTLAIYRQAKLSTIWAVVIGVSRFKDSNINLKYADKDAQAFYEFLKSPQGGRVDDKHIRLLTNEQATSPQILNELTNFLKQANKDDVVIIYLATHGLPDPSGMDLYYLGYNSDVDNLMGTAISNTQIMNIARGVITAGKVVMFIDACHSGGTGLAPTLMAKRDPTFVNRLVLKIAEARDGVAIFSASSSSGFSNEGPQWDGHGVFTYYLLRGLRGEANEDNNDVITIGELYDYLRTNVKKATNGNQLPELKGNHDNNMPLAVIK